MKAAVIVFPGSNCDRDIQVALRQSMGSEPQMVWHKDADFDSVDLICLPGGFSYGDYLRCGAMSAKSPVMKEVIARANKGVPVLGICNGFQILAESGLVPGALMRNAGLKFVCRDLHLKVERNDSIFTSGYAAGQTIRIPVAHHDGNYFVDSEGLKALEDNNQVAFRYCGADGTVDLANNPNGSLNNIAGVYNAKGNVLGMMPHPERLCDAALGGTDGRAMFESLVAALS
ncbi:phosphoribosylformylglycinamidine synthase subunit PurQ [Kiloniella laminariae]|uniref:Phosphoribosylformylglycinamidine synthase subunit PurQ n=1 Tax=Kiloniella laminariae TaxID=454162 RepID=A0ABT4LHN7_9PROT|nr:phosphoribosylformylglycinamidine synthase subunit PurQ [Kiloniella laminariae]MCZ4280610.1 phosphoribosylformylglycinamidine synthase subunit PurQ [Kiloniella laminariae]